MIRKIFFFSWFMVFSACGTDDREGDIPSGYYRQAILGQWKLWNRLTDNPSLLSSEEKIKYALVQKIRVVAQTVGLDVGKNYVEIMPLDGKAVSYTVSATEEFSLTPIRWDFLMIGKAPYIGFFDREKATQYQQTLPKNWDTSVSEVRAYSLLGWMPDPLPTSLLKLSDIDLVDTIFHELVHRTVWIKNAVFENEQLATFVAEELTRQFAPQLLSIDSEKVDQYYQRQKMWDDAMLNIKKQLENLYAQKQLSMEDMRVQKKNLILSGKSIFPDTNWDRFNNTHFVNVQLYSAENQELIQSRKRCPTLQKFLQEIQQFQGFNVCKVSNTKSQ